MLSMYLYTCVLMPGCVMHSMLRWGLGMPWHARKPWRQELWAHCLT